MPTATRTFSGACTCGAAHFEFDATDAAPVESCSCEWCQRLRAHVISVPANHVHGASECLRCGARLFTTQANEARRLVNLRFVKNVALLRAA